jgi:hypothetical protein
VSDLKSCPCCGHRAELQGERTDYGDWCTIECLGCGLMIDGGDKQAIIDAWQRRRTDGMIAWLDAEIEKCNYTYYDYAYCEVNLERVKALQQCKQQLQKLLDGMGVGE